MDHSFSDKRLEEEFRRSYEQRTRENIRSGLIFLLLAWSVAVGLTYLLYPQYFARLAIVVGLTTYPYFLFVIYTACR